MNLFPADFPSNLTGFGGDRTLNQAQHRASLKKTPVILVHGNGGHSAHPRWGMQTLGEFLKSEGYQDSEIWAMDYLGENNAAADLNDPHRNRIDAFRSFVDRVREYLRITRVDFVAHSLGAGMVNAYLRGLQRSGQWNNAQHRLDVAGTFVSLAGATYGLGTGSVSEFRTGSDFERRSHQFERQSRLVADDSPGGSNNASEQQAPVGAWTGVTALDAGQVYYVALIAAGDFVDVQHPDTGRREGAHLNRRFNLGSGLDGHERIIKSRTVFNVFRTFLNRYPPLPPALITVDKDSGSFGSPLQVNVTVTPDTVPVTYIAQRVTRRFEAGFIGRTVLETLQGRLVVGQPLTLSTDGVWEVEFRADGADSVQRTYGVNVVIPEVTLLTDNSEPFTGSLEVAASTSGGTLYHSTDREHWAVGSAVTIDRTATVWFIAIDARGSASAMLGRAYEKRIAWTDSKTATLTEHFLARRLSVNEYVSFGLELGFNAVITLYLVDGRWTRQPGAQVPPGDAGPRGLAAARPATLISADQPNGMRPAQFAVTLRAASPRPEGARIYYTLDGSDPSDASNPSRLSFRSTKKLRITGSGPHAVLCYAQDATGRGSFEAFAWSIGAAA